MFSRKDIVQYINDRHLEDGGYFFARITPSSGLDTFLAVQTLKLLKAPVPATSIEKFWGVELESDNLDNLQSVYLAAATLTELGKYPSHLKSIAESVCQIATQKLFKSKAFHFQEEKFDITTDTTNSLFLDVVEGEAKNLYYFAEISKLFNLPYEAKRLFTFIESLHNDDGGYGSVGGSDISTTYYMLAIFSSLHEPIPHKREVTKYLKQKFEEIHYLEEYYWIAWGLTYLNETIPDRELLISFLHSCALSSGGFIRSQFMGAASIEYTAQAVSLIRLLEKRSEKLIG